MSAGDVQVPDGDRDVETVHLAAVRARQDARRINRPEPHQATMAMRDVDFLLAKVDEFSSTLTACAALASQPAQSGDGVAEAVARERERIATTLERLVDLRKDYLPGLTGGDLPHIDLIAHEINTASWVLRILRGGDARGWAHSSRWDDLEGLDVLARTTTEGADHG